MDDVIDSATPLEMGLVHQRPRLFLTPARLEFLRASIAMAPYDGFLRQVRDFADSRMTPALPDWTKGDTRGHGCALPHLALMFLLTDDSRYRDRALAMIRSAAGMVNIGLSGGHSLGGMAIAYDWLYTSMSVPERAEFADLVFTYGTHTFEDIASFKRGTVGILTCNHLPVEMYGLTAAGCALYGEKPHISRWLRLCVEKSRLMAGALGDDGASQEGIGYGQYYNEFFIKMLVLIKELMGVDLFKECAYLRNLPLFYLYSGISREAWSPQATLINFGDGVRHNWYGPDAHLRVLAGLYRDPLAQWLADQHQAAATAVNSGSFLNMTHFDPTVRSKAPHRLPRSRRFADKDIVYQRSGWHTGEAVLAYRCGPHFGHHVLHRYTGEVGGGHMQANNGTVYLIAGGDYLLSGDGYFRKLTEYGNTLRLGGQGQEGEGGEWFESLTLRRQQRGPRILADTLNRKFEYVIGDVAPAYPAALKIRRLLRKIVYLRPMTWVVIDEIETAEPVTMEARFHSDFPFVAEGKSWMASGKAYALRLTAHGTTDWISHTETQPCAYVDGTVTRHYPVLRLETGRQLRSALVTLLEVLPLASERPAAPNLRMDGRHMNLTLTRHGSRATFRIRFFADDLLAIGVEQKAGK